MVVFSKNGVSGLLIYALDNGTSSQLQFNSGIHIEIVFSEALGKKDEPRLDRFSCESDAADLGLKKLTQSEETLSDSIGQENIGNCQTEDVENIVGLINTNDNLVKKGKQSCNTNKVKVEEILHTSPLDQCQDVVSKPVLESNGITQSQFPFDGADENVDNDWERKIEKSYLCDTENEKEIHLPKNLAENEVPKESKEYKKKIKQNDVSNSDLQLKGSLTKGEINKKSHKLKKRKTQENIEDTKNLKNSDDSLLCKNKFVTDNCKIKDTSNVQCPYCLVWFKTRREFMDHRKAKKSSHKCSICGKEEPYKAYLLVHMKKHQEDEEVLGVKTNDNVKKRKSRMKCSLCGLVVSSADSLKIHSMLHTGEMAYCCCVCQETFPSLSAREHHAGLHLTEFKFHCVPCDKGFATRADLAKHQLAHKLQCSICGQAFPNKTSRYCHYRVAHPSQILNCTECFKIFPNKEELAQHLTYHRKLKRKVCPECGAVVCKLKDHMLIHEKERGDNKIFACDQCPQTYLRQCSLYKHMLTHTGERPYACSHCTKCFRTNGMLRKHLLTHTLEKPHQCDQCGKRFSMRSNMVIHMRVHQNFPTKYKCDHCFQMFNHQNTLTNHIRAKHSNSVKSRQVSKLTNSTIKIGNNSFLKRLDHIKQGLQPYSDSFSIPESIPQKNSQSFPLTISVPPSSTHSSIVINEPDPITLSTAELSNIGDCHPKKKTILSQQNPGNSLSTMLPAPLGPYPPAHNLTHLATPMETHPSRSSQYIYLDNYQLPPSMHMSEKRKSHFHSHITSSASSIINVPSCRNIFPHQDDLFSLANNVSSLARNVPELIGNLFESLEVVKNKNNANSTKEQINNT